MSENLDPETAAAIAETKRRNFEKAGPAALRVCAYLVRCRPNYLDMLVDEEKIALEDFLTLLAHNGISGERYEG